MDDCEHAEGIARHGAANVSRGVPIESPNPSKILSMIVSTGSDDCKRLQLALHGVITHVVNGSRPSSGMQ